MAMKRDGVTADNDKLNLLREQQCDKLVQIVLQIRQGASDDFL
jgi:hypothetical protein